jgi:hypothetical protein
MLLCAGALSARWSVFRAGFQAAADPKYVVGPQRARIQAGKAQGGAGDHRLATSHRSRLTGHVIIARR